MESSNYTNLHELLHERSELVSKYRHVNKIYFQNIKLTFQKDSAYILSEVRSSQTALLCMLIFSIT